MGLLVQVWDFEWGCEFKFGIVNGAVSSSLGL